MDNWLLIIVGVIFLISIVVGYIRGMLKIGISLLATAVSYTHLTLPTILLV